MNNKRFILVKNASVKEYEAIRERILADVENGLTHIVIHFPHNVIEIEVIEVNSEAMTIINSSYQCKCSE